MFLQILIIGLTTGAMYALVSLGLTLIFGIAQVVNFAQGELFMLGAYTGYVATSVIGLAYPLAVILTIVVMAIVGLVFERVVIRPVIDKPWQVSLISTLAASIILSNAALLVWGGIPKQLPTTLESSTVTLGGVEVSYQRILILGVALLAFGLFYLFIERTKTGKAMRAMSQSKESCEVLGIDIRRISAITFAIGAAMAGLAGALIAPVYAISPTMGLSTTLKAFAIVIMGGFGNAKGAIYAAFLIGLAEAFTSGYLSTDYKDATAYVVLLAVLLLRPHGLFGRQVGI